MPPANRSSDIYRDVHRCRFISTSDSDNSAATHSDRSTPDEDTRDSAPIHNNPRQVEPGADNAGSNAEDLNKSPNPRHGLPLNLLQPEDSSTIRLPLKSADGNGSSSSSGANEIRQAIEQQQQQQQQSSETSKSTIKKRPDTPLPEAEANQRSSDVSIFQQKSYKAGIDQIPGLEASPTLMTLTSFPFRIFSINSAASDLLGASCIGKSILEVVIGTEHEANSSSAPKVYPRPSLNLCLVNAFDHYQAVWVLARGPIPWWTKCTITVHPIYQSPFQIKPTSKELSDQNSASRIQTSTSRELSHYAIGVKLCM